MQDIPDFHYFRSGNPFSGSSGRFRYRIEAAGEALTASAWFGPYAMGATPEAEIRRENFPLTKQGLSAAVEWLENFIEKEKGEDET